MKSYKFKVFGRVQGVWFRKFTKDIATKLGVNGEVKNLEDGSVGIVATFKNKEQFDKFLDYIKKGPPLARVDRVEVEEIDKMFEDGFRIVK